MKNKFETLTIHRKYSKTRNICATNVVIILHESEFFLTVIYSTNIKTIMGEAIQPFFRVIHLMDPSTLGAKQSPGAKR